MELSLGFFAFLVFTGYALNVVRTRDVSTDRLTLRAPIVALFATFMFVPLCVALSPIAAVPLFLVMVLGDITPGVIAGTDKQHVPARGSSRVTAHALKMR